MARCAGLITGPKHTGKTTATATLVDELRQAGVSLAGVLAPVVCEGNDRIGYDLIDLASHRREPFLRRPAADQSALIGPFAVMEAGLTLGREALSPGATAAAEVVIVDEFGPAELAGGGWRDAVDRIVADEDGRVLLVVREALAEEVANLYGAVCVARWGTMSVSDVLNLGLARGL